MKLGANHQGEIDYTTKLAQPDAALINNIAPAHLEGFGSLEGVVQAKGEIYRGLTSNGVAIINAEHDHLNVWQKEIRLNMRSIFLTVKIILQKIFIILIKVLLLHLFPHKVKLRLACLTLVRII